MIEMYGWSSIP